MRNYTPRRANKKRWLQEAPDYVLDVLDNKGKSCDRYTVLFTFPLSYTHNPNRIPQFSNEPGEFRDTYIQYLMMSDSPSSPQGVSMWGEMKAYEAASYRYSCGKQRVRWLDLPEHIRKHVIARATQD